MPLIGVAYYMVHSPKKDAILFGFVGMVGIFVYLSIGVVFI